METKNWQKFPVLFSLYIAQSIPMSFFSTVVPVIMRQEHYSLESIGLMQLVKLPWIFKFLWAPYIDNTAQSGRSLRRWIIFSELFYAMVIIGVGFFDLQTDFKLIIILIVIAFLASATQDIATDIFAIHILKSGEKGWGNSMQSAGSFAGTLMGTGVMLLAYYYFGWQNLLLLLAGFVVFAILPLLVYRPELNIDRAAKKRIRIPDIFRFFNSKASLKRLLILVFYYSGIIGILAMMKPYMVDLGYNVKEIGFMSGIVGTAVAASCALLAGYIIKRLGRKVTIYLFAGMNLLAAVFFFAISLHTPTLLQLYVAICLVWGAYGLSTVIIYTTSMDAVRLHSEGTDFTVQIVITHLSGMIIAILSGRLGDKLGYNGLFGVEVLLCLVSIAVVFYNYPVKRSSDGN
jgi:predicted MFS family arabinose efflux permease